MPSNNKNIIGNLRRRYEPHAKLSANVDLNHKIIHQLENETRALEKKVTDLPKIHSTLSKSFGMQRKTLTRVIALEKRVSGNETRISNLADVAIKIGEEQAERKKAIVEAAAEAAEELGEEIPEGLDDVLDDIRGDDAEVGSTKTKTKPKAKKKSKAKKKPVAKKRGKKSFSKVKDKVKAEKFFNLAQEVRAQGTLGGKTLTPEQRKAGFKAAKGGVDSVNWKEFIDSVEETKSASDEGITPNTKMLPGSSDMGQGVLEGISTDVKSILGVIDSRTEVEKDTADEMKQEDEKDKRKKKEEDKEKGAKKGMKVPGFITKAAAPITNIWGQIVKTFGVLLAGWGIDKIFKWLQNPKNEKAVENLKEFITVAAPAIIKGILAYVALDIGLKVIKFAAMLAKGSLTLLGGLKNFTVTLGKWAATNPQIALAIGLGALLVGGAIVAHNQLKKNRQASDEQDDDSTLTVDEFSEQEDKSKVDVKPSQSYSEVGSFPGMMNFNTGGTVPGSGNKDTVPAMLTPGEFVMSRGAVQKWGAGTLAGMNSAGGGTNKPTMGRYRTGGMASDDAAGMDMDAMVNLFMNDMKLHYGITNTKAPNYLMQQQLDIANNAKLPLGMKMTEDGQNIDLGRFAGDKVKMMTEMASDPKYADRLKEFGKQFGYNNLDAKQFKEIAQEEGHNLKVSINKFIPGTESHALDQLSQSINQSTKQSVNFNGGGLVPFPIQKFKGGGKVNSIKTATQLINSVPSGASDAKVTVLPVPSGGSGGSSGGGGSGNSDEPIFSPLDPDNFSTLIMKSMYSILD